MVNNLLDRIGISATSLCAIHCLLLPIMLPALPVLGLEVLADDLVERSYLLATVILGFFALYSGFKRYHRKMYPFYLLALGGLIYWYKHDLDTQLQSIAVIVGASLVVVAHIINIRLCNQCRRCEADETCSSS